MTKGPRNDVSPNRISQSDKKEIEKTRTKLRKKGVGEDHATKLAVREVADGDHSGAGGGQNAGADAPKQPKTGKRGSRAAGGGTRTAHG